MQEKKKAFAARQSPEKQNWAEDNDSDLKFYEPVPLGGPSPANDKSPAKGKTKETMDFEELERLYLERKKKIDIEFESKKQDI
jgi:hypothetical protein